MKRFLVGRSGLWVLALLPALAAGCNTGDDKLDPQVLTSHRERLMLAEEPDGAVSVLEVRESIARPTEVSETAESPASGPSEGAAPADPKVAPTEVVIVGRIGGVPNPWKQAQPDYPWTAKQAQFVIADAAAAAEIEDHGHSHDDPDHDCPFCASAAKSEVVAVVRFMDESGKIIPVDARQLFEVQGEEMVVVRGKPHMLGDAKDGVLVVDANGLYVRR